MVLLRRSGSLIGERAHQVGFGNYNTVNGGDAVNFGDAWLQLEEDNLKPQLIAGHYGLTEPGLLNHSQEYQLFLPVLNLMYGKMLLLLYMFLNILKKKYCSVVLK